MAEQLAQNYPAAHAAPMGSYGPEGAPPAEGGKSFSAKMADSVRKHPRAALAVIIALVLVVLFLYAQGQGWFGLGGGGGKPSKRGGGGPKRPRAAAAVDEDPETEELIESINGSSGR